MAAHNDSSCSGEEASSSSSSSSSSSVKEYSEGKWYFQHVICIENNAFTLKDYWNHYATKRMEEWMYSKLGIGVVKEEKIKIEGDLIHRSIFVKPASRLIDLFARFRRKEDGDEEEVCYKTKQIKNSKELILNFENEFYGFVKDYVISMKGIVTVGQGRRGTEKTIMQTVQIQYKIAVTPRYNYSFLNTLSSFVEGSAISVLESVINTEMQKMMNLFPEYIAEQKEQENQNVEKKR
jgi:hypothetical protein